MTVRRLCHQASFIDGGYNIAAVMTARCGFTAAAGSFQSLFDDPLDPELRNNGGYVPTHALVPTSVALNRVPASREDCADGMLLHIGLPFDLTDARGVARPQNGNCDVGAFEIGPSFRRGVRTLAITGAGTGQGSVSGGGLECAIAGGATSGQCSREYGPGTVVTPTATAAAGSIFVGWAGDPECADGSVLMDGDKHCTAIFDLRALSVSGSANGVGNVRPPKSQGRAEVTFDAAFAFAGAIDLGVRHGHHPCAPQRGGRERRRRAGRGGADRAAGPSGRRQHRRHLRDAVGRGAPGHGGGADRAVLSVHRGHRDRGGDDRALPRAVRDGHAARDHAHHQVHHR